jgi:hypothetical protein
MTATNPITGDKIQTKPSKQYADNYDAIFGKKDADKQNEKDSKSIQQPIN